MGNIILGDKKLDERVQKKLTGAFQNPITVMMKAAIKNERVMRDLKLKGILNHKQSSFSSMFE